MTTLVIGAGMAGLSAAYHLQRAEETVTVLEARGRLGGRVYTDHDIAGYPVELGAELIHGENVVTWEWVRRLRLDTLHWEKGDDSMVRLADGRWLTMAEACRVDPDFAITRTWKLPETNRKPQKDESWGDYLRHIGFTNEQIAYVKRSYNNAMGDDMRYLSAISALNEINDAVSGDNDYRILDGYKTIVDALADGLDIHLNAPVATVRWGEGGVEVETVPGAIFTADRAIITLPVGVLQAGAVTFNPLLPLEKQIAIENTQMGPVIKMVFTFDAPILPTEIGAIYSRHNPPMWWSPSFGRGDVDTVTWTAFLSGDWARDMLALGEDAALEAAIAALRNELGQPDLQATSRRLVNWVDDPFSRGGYTLAKPGYHDTYQDLGAPTPPLYWAGEATAPNNEQATVHGAYLSGQRAANEILALTRA